MRLYSFVNYYLSPLQAGLQTAHLIGEMSVASYDTFVRGSYNVWARDHKTIIILNGGNCDSLAILFDRLVELNNNMVPLPIAKFCEDVQSLNGALTAVGVIVPEHIYTHAAAEYFSPDMGPHELTQYNILPVEHELAVLIRSCPLAR